MADINISLGGLEVIMSSDATYPDALDDLSSRAKKLFQETLEIVEQRGFDPMEIQFVSHEFCPHCDSEEDEEED